MAEGLVGAQGAPDQGGAIVDMTVTVVLIDSAPLVEGDFPGVGGGVLPFGDDATVVHIEAVGCGIDSTMNAEGSF